jgi:anaerobic magnesium-protoporphyrin IX monomethyl ester cyclase
MRVAIVASPYPLEEAPSPPLGVCYVAAACEEAGADVTILDYIVRKYSPEKLASEMDAFRPDVIGANSVTMNFKGAAAIMQDAKRHNPDVVTMMGGPHVSFDAASTLNKYPGIDLIVIGEGEETLKELLPVIHNRSKWEHVAGIAFRKDGEVVFTGRRELIHDLDTLPKPARHLLPMNRYQALGFPVSIITSRGCPNQCIFCLGRRMVGYKVRYRSPKLVVDEVEEILSYGFTRINIADDLFTSNKDRVRIFCDEIKKRGIKFTWTAFSRVNTVDEEVLAMMKETGCDTVSFGIETGNTDMLKRIRKGITLDQARKAVEACRKTGVTPHASFVIGLPGETHESINDTKTFAESLGIDYGYHLLAPFPGTTIWEETEKFDVEILTDDFDLYDANHAIVKTSGLTPKDIEEFMNEHLYVHEEIWKEVVRRVNEGISTDYEWLRVVGHRRMNLVFKMLNGDLIEELGGFDDGNGSIENLSARIAEATDTDPDLTFKTLDSLIEKGFIKSSSTPTGTQWFWTYNNFSDYPPEV